MKASVVSAYGGPEVMKYQDMPDPELGVGDVLVKVAGIGINPEDMLERNGDLRGSVADALSGDHRPGRVGNGGRDGATASPTSRSATVSAGGRTTRTLN